jgi:hypothetical protein
VIKNRMETVYFEKQNTTSEQPVIQNSYTTTNNKSFYSETHMFLCPTCPRETLLAFSNTVYRRLRLLAS